MQLFGDFQFFCAAVVCSAVAITLGLTEKKISCFGLLSSAFFAVMAMKENPTALFWLAVYLLLEFLIVRGYLYLYGKLGKRTGIYYLFLLLSLAPLVIEKTAGEFELSLFGFIGISYMTFKTVQMVIEIYDGMIQRITAFEFFYLLLFFPCLLSGPIDRSLRFRKDLEQRMDRAEYVDLMGRGIMRIAWGFVYKFAISSIFFQLASLTGHHIGLRGQIEYMYSYGFYLFFDFAGYSLMATGIAYLFGIRCPDNFNKPFMSVDMKEFWDRWHITLSHWFRDYLFSRFVRNAIRGKWFGSKLGLSSAAFMINMGVMGLWHGLSSCYILYGLYHGVLLALTEIYQKKSSLYKKYKKEKWYRCISWFLTFHLVMFGFYIFSGRFNEVLFVGIK